MANVVVIGAGIGGLTAAVSLAVRGRDVLVLEAAQQPGGKAGTIVVDGVELDTGPSLLTLPSVFDAVLQEAGTSLAEELELLRPSPAFRYLYADGACLDIHHSADATLASVRDTLGARAEAELSDFLAYAKRIWDAAAPAFVFGEAPRWSKLVLGGPRTWLAASRIDPFRTMKNAIDGRVQSPHLRTLLYRYATYNGSDVRRAPGTLNCIAHVELTLGGFAIKGGMYELVRALVRIAERVGVRIQCGARVSEIDIEGGRAAGVRLHGGGRVDAHAIVANTDVTHLVEALLPSNMETGIAMGGAPSMSAHNAILKASATGWTDRVAHTVMFPDRYLQEFEDIFDRSRLPMEPTIYICAQHACHQRVGWPDAEPLFLMINAPGGVDWTANSGQTEAGAPLWKEVHARLVRRGLAEASDRIVWSRTPQDLASRFPGSGGSLYGAASNDPWVAFRRPSNVIRKVPGLYLASGTAHPGGGVPLAACSGRQAAAAVWRDSGGPEEGLRECLAC